MVRRSYNRKGFTLIEAMLAVTLLAIATSGVILPFAGGSAAQAESARQSLAAQLASDMLEKISNDDYSNMIFWNGNYEPEGSMMDATGQVLSDPVYADYCRVVTLQPASVASVGLWHVTVYVYENQVVVMTMSMLIGE